MATLALQQALAKRKGLRGMVGENIPAYQQQAQADLQSPQIQALLANLSSITPQDPSAIANITPEMPRTDALGRPVPPLPVPPITAEGERFWAEQEQNKLLEAQKWQQEMTNRPFSGGQDVVSPGGFDIEEAMKQAPPPKPRRQIGVRGMLNEPIYEPEGTIAYHKGEGTETPTNEQGFKSVLAERPEDAKKETFINKNIGKGKFEYGGESVFHETDPDNAVNVLGSASVDKSGLFVSDDPNFALGQKGKGAIVEFDKKHLTDHRGVLREAKVLANEVLRGTGQRPKEFILTGGSSSPTAVKSITLKPNTQIDKRSNRTLNRFFNSEQLEDGSIKFTPKWLDFRKKELADEYDKEPS